MSHTHSTYAGAPSDGEVKEKALIFTIPLGMFGPNALFGHSIYPHPLPPSPLHGSHLGRKRGKTPLTGQNCSFAPSAQETSGYPSTSLPEGWALYGIVTHWHLGLDSCVSPRASNSYQLLWFTLGMTKRGNSSHTDLLSKRATKERQEQRSQTGRQGYPSTVICLKIFFLARWIYLN